MGFGNKGNKFGYVKFSRGGQGQGGARQHTRFGNNGGGFRAGIKSGG